MINGHVTVYHYNDTRSTVTRLSFDNDQRHGTAFRPISEAAHSWSYDKTTYDTSINDTIIYRDNTSNLRKMFAYYLWPWLGPPLATLYTSDFIVLLAAPPLDTRPCISRFALGPGFVYRKVTMLT